MALSASEPPVGFALQERCTTAAGFLAWDENQTVKHEFVRGDVFLMTGVTDRHNTAAMTLMLASRTHLRGTPCRVFASDIRLRVDAADCFDYPDLMVTCSATDANDRLIKREPVLVVDVDTRRYALYRKGADGLWVLHPTGPDEAVRLACVDLNVSAEALRAEVDDADEAAADAVQPPMMGKPNTQGGT